MPPTSRSLARRQVLPQFRVRLMATESFLRKALPVAPSLPPVARIGHQTYLTHMEDRPPGSVRMASTATRSRSLHSSSNRASISPDNLAITSATDVSTSPEMNPRPPPPLAMLPLSGILRSLLTTTISSSPTLLSPSLALMSSLANAKNPILNPDRNRFLRYVLKKTFYAQYCAGESTAEVRSTISSLKKLGFSGVILGYAREVVLTASQTADLASGGTGAAAEECIQSEINPWATGTMETVLLAAPGDYVALKFTGAGRQALYHLSQRQPPSPALASAIDSICALAASRGVRLLFDAEQQAVQPGIDDWTLEYMCRYNRSSGGGDETRATIFGTYQAYLKGTPATLSAHLAAAQRGGFTLGVKLVRGAYLGSDPRHVIHDTKADTDAAYDSIAEALLLRVWASPLVRPELSGNASVAFPSVDMVLASHNRESVRKAKAILDRGESGTGVAFAQLQGMADEVSCELACSAGGSETHVGIVDGERAVDVARMRRSQPRVYKYLVWGSTGECMKYLLRRAQENRDAVQRTRDGRDAMRAELWRRVKAVFGLSL